MNQIVKYAGIKRNLGGTDYIIPPLSLGAMEVMQERLEAFQGGTDMASIKVVVDATHAALKRNYPDITRDDVAEVVDLGNMQEVMECVMDVSGLKRKSIESEAVGEAGKPLIGETSTPTSQLAQDGASPT